MTPDFNIQIVSNLPFEVTLQTLRDQIAAQDMMILHEIDTQMIVKKSGLEIPPLRQLLYFHPRFMKRVLEGNPASVIEAPLKFAVRQSESGEVHCGYVRPEYLFGRYEKMGEMGAELDGIAAKIASSLL